MTEQIQSLDYQIIERASEKFSNVREVVIHLELDGKIESFIVEMYKHISPISVKFMVQELIEKLDHVRASDKNTWSSLIVPYTMFLCIKHFTTLKLPNVYAEQLKAIEHMTNTGTMFQIFMAFDEDELAKVRQEIQLVLENFNKNMNESEEFKDAIRENLVDKSLME